LPPDTLLTHHGSNQNGFRDLKRDNFPVGFISRPVSPADRTLFRTPVNPVVAPV